MGLTFNTGLLSDAIKADSSLNVGIGTSSLANYFSKTLTIDGASSQGIMFRASGSDKAYMYWSSDYAVFGANTGGIIFKTADAERMRITSSGKFAFGMTATDYGVFSIRSNNTTAYMGLNLYALGNNNFIYMNHDNNVGIIGTEFGTGGTGHTPLTFQSGGSERMRIGTDGRVFIGVAGSSNGHKLEINAGSSSAIRVDVTSGTNGISMSPGAVFGIDKPGIGGGTFKIDSNGNVGINSASPKGKLHNVGSFVTESTNFYGEAKSFSFQSAFDNPTITLLTMNNTATYGLTIIRVTIYQNGVAGSIPCNIQVGYAYYNGTGGTKGATNPTIVASFNGGTNTGNLTWSGSSLQYTTSRMTNYDGYTIVVEWGANRDNNAAPTYGGYLQ